MPFDSFVVAAVVHEIRASLVGAQVAKIYQPGQLDLDMHFRTRSGKVVLFASAHPEWYRLLLASSEPPNPPTPPQFCMLLRKHLEGARLDAVEHHGLDRAVKLNFRRSDGCRHLIVELMGKHSNIVLVDSENRILGCIKPVSSRISRVRQVLPGLPYAPPPDPSKPSPLELTKEEMTSLLGGARVDAAVLTNSFSGLGTFAAREICARAETSDADRCAAALFELVQRLRAGGFRPTVLLSPDGKPTDFWAFEIRQLSPGKPEPRTSISAAVEEVLDARMAAEQIEEKRKQFAAQAQRVLRMLESNISQAENALIEAERAEEYRIAGELLMANLHRLQPGSASVELPNFYDPEQRLISIPLDPAKTPAENAADYFERHKKALNAAKAAGERLEKLRRDYQTVADMASSAQQADLEGIERLESELSRLFPMPTTQPQPLPVKHKKQEHIPKIKHLRTEDGWEILIGETKEANDYLTTKIASPDDLWFHVRAAASAHVIVRTGKRPDAVPPRVIAEAARLAALHSEAKHSSVVAVDYTLKRYVHKPRGSPPGQVVYRNEKTIHVNPNETNSSESVV
jgi:predicted ribosome quality control (RQC) complex YloA/Tae2 family protein